MAVGMAAPGTTPLMKIVSGVSQVPSCARGQHPEGDTGETLGERKRRRQDKACVLMVYGSSIPDCVPFPGGVLALLRPGIDGLIFSIRILSSAEGWQAAPALPQHLGGTGVAVLPPPHPSSPAGSTSPPSPPRGTVSAFLWVREV